MHHCSVQIIYVS